MPGGARPGLERQKTHAWCESYGFHRHTDAYFYGGGDHAQVLHRCHGLGLGPQRIH